MDALKALRTIGRHFADALMIGYVVRFTLDLDPRYARLRQTFISDMLQRMRMEMAGGTVISAAVIALMYILLPWQDFVIVASIVAAAATYPAFLVFWPNVEDQIERHQRMFLVFIGLKDTAHGAIAAVTTIFVLKQLGNPFDLAMLQLSTGAFFGLVVLARGYALTGVVSLTLVSLATLYTKHTISPDALPLFDLIVVVCYIFSCATIVRIHAEDVRNRLASAERDEFLVEVTEAKEKLTAYGEELARRNKELDRLAWFDPLTGIANRRAFENHVSKLTDSSRRPSPCLFMIIDIDGFKTINDGLGHMAGDCVLAEVGTRLANLCGEGDFAARLGGDEFVIIFDLAQREEDASRLPEQVAEDLRRPISLGSETRSISTSVGYVAGPPGEDLRICADLALLEAKKKRGLVVAFEPPMLEEMLTDNLLRSELADALARCELALHYQPKQDLLTGKVTGFEALLRWNNKRCGAVPPPRIVTTAYRAGLAPQLAAYVIRHAALFRKRLVETGWDNVHVSLNLSPRDLAEFAVSDIFRNILTELDLEGDGLEVEVTEEIFLDVAAVEGELRALAALGLKLAVDDFGAGFSSMTSLKDFEFQVLKIDRSFVDDIATSDRARSVFSAMIGVGHALDMDIVAEGIETPEQWASARRCGAAKGQGYLFSRPLPDEAAIEYLSQHERCHLKPLPA